MRTKIKLFKVYIKSKIKPILKLLNKEQIKSDEDMINFYIEQ